MTISIIPGQTACAVCGKTFYGGRYAVDLWDNIFCPDHRDTLPTCSACHRIICPRLTQGGVVYHDGRQICNLCRQTAVDTNEQAKPIVEGVASWLYHKVGIRFKGLTLKIELQDTRHMLQTPIVSAGLGDRSSPTGLGHGQILGYISRAKQMRGGKEEKRLVQGVTLLSGLPRELLEGVAAHELGHAWLFLGHVDHLSPWQEEGFCNLLSYLWHKERTTPSAQFFTKLLELDPNPIYGEGFRRIRELFRKHGFGSALTYTYEHRRFPS